MQPVMTVTTDPLALVPSLLIREEPFYFRAPGIDDPLRLAYRRIAASIRADNVWDIEFRLERAEGALARGDGGPADRLLRDLAGEAPAPLPAKRVLAAANAAAQALLETPGPLDV